MTGVVIGGLAWEEITWEGFSAAAAIICVLFMGGVGLMMGLGLVVGVGTILVGMVLLAEKLLAVAILAGAVAVNGAMGVAEIGGGDTEGDGTGGEGRLGVKDTGDGGVWLGEEIAVTVRSGMAGPARALGEGSVAGVCWTAEIVGSGVGVCSTRCCMGAVGTGNDMDDGSMSWEGDGWGAGKVGVAAIVIGLATACPCGERLADCGGLIMVGMGAEAGGIGGGKGGCDKLGSIDGWFGTGEDAGKLAAGADPSIP